jgi:putative hemolysin
MLIDPEPASLWLDLLGLAFVPLLVLLNGYFVAAEFALVAVRKTQVEEFVRKGRPGSQVLMEQVKHLDRSIAATQLGITLASISLGWIGEPALADLLRPAFSFLAGGAKTAVVHTLAVIVAFTLITLMHIVLGELAPKAIALQRPGTVALWIALPFAVFVRISRPLVVSMNYLGNAVVRLMGFEGINAAHMVHSVEELRMLVAEVEEAGLLSEEQATYVQNVFRLSSKRVADCMVPVEKMAALDLHLSPEQILEKVREGAHTRMPVYEGGIDNIVGIVNTKDLFHLFSLQHVVILQDALYAPLFVNPDQPVADALRLFKSHHRPMAIVRAPDGKTLGLITLEDILEEIVGDIEDEHDRPGARRLLARLRAGERLPSWLARPK